MKKIKLGINDFGRIGETTVEEVNAFSTIVTNKTQIKIYAWYDNEWGYANRTVELARLVGSA